MQIPKVDESKIPKTRHEEFTGEEYHASELAAKLWACKEAWRKLKDRLNKPGLSYYFGLSHPFGK